MKKRLKKRLNIILGIVILVILVVAIYFTFFFSYRCNDLACFQGHQEKCSKVKFVKQGEDIVWEYKIKGEKNNFCNVNVKALEIKQGTLDKKILENKEMTCLLPLRSLIIPEGDISLCTGELKEELQNLIIQKLHAYIIDNVGDISEELNKTL